MNVPATHLACAAHTSVSTLDVDVTDLNKPSVQDSHSGWLMLLPATLVNSPAPHLLCALQVSTFTEEVDVLALNRPLEHD